MAEKSPQDLDKLFQQEPDEFQFGYNAEAWSEMENLLDKDDRRRFLWWWFFGIGGLILMGVIFFFGKNERAVVDANLDFDKKEVVRNESQSQKTEDVTTQLQKNVFEKINKNEINSTSKTTNSISSKNQKEALKTITNDSGSGVIKNGNLVLRDSVLENVNLITNEILSGTIKSKTVKDEVVNVLLQSDSVSTIPMIEILAERENEIKVNLLEKDTSEFQFVLLGYTNEKIVLLGLVIGSESSATNRNNFSKLNWKFGAQVEYRFFRKWSTSIGANFTRKKYNSSGNEYSPPAGFWTDAVTPQTIDANCNILEVPVSIGYFFKNDNGNLYLNNESGFYTKLGLTSFFMLQEQYDYTYELIVPNQILNWKGKSKHKHWFGIGEFSFGYQHFFQDKTSVQFEPFLQLPLTGIGHGNVKLWSIGLNMKLNFQVNKRLKKYHWQKN